jgi:hypothetical protein
MIITNGGDTATTFKDHARAIDKAACDLNAVLCSARACIHGRNQPTDLDVRRHEEYIKVSCALQGYATTLYELAAKSDARS